MDIDHHGIPRTKLTNYDENSHPTVRRKLLGCSQAGSWKHASPEKSGALILGDSLLSETESNLQVPFVINTFGGVPGVPLN